MQSQAVQICIIQRSLEKQIQKIYQDLYKGRYRSWFTQLRRLRSSTICCLQAGDTGEFVIEFILNLKEPENQGR